MRSYQRMFLPGLFLSAVLLAGAGPLRAHTFTNDEGKTFEGEITRITGPSVAIVRSSDQRPFVFPIAHLSMADQSYIGDWKLAHPQLKLDFNVVKESQKGETKNNSGPLSAQSSRGATESFNIEIKNNNPDATPPLVLYYTLARELKGDAVEISRMPGMPVINTSGKLEIPIIPAFSSKTVTTLSLRASKSSSVPKDVEGGDIRKSEVAIKGLFLVVYLNENQVAEWKTPGLEGHVNMAAARGEVPQEPKRGFGDPPKVDPWAARN